MNSEHQEELEDFPEEDQMLYDMEMEQELDSMFYEWEMKNETEGTEPCNCHMCRKKAQDRGENLPNIMVVCPICGNKRCPKATDHTLECTGSNEPGQNGSIY